MLTKNDAINCITASSTIKHIDCSDEVTNLVSLKIICNENTS